jgi:hypothetical protein
VTQAEWENILEAFPRSHFKDYFIGTLANLCRLKPQVTYDNFLAGFGENYVPGYNKTGHRIVDLIEAVLTDG